jgi:hypothetical protein
MARVCSTARVTREGEETKATETAPISEVMRQSGLVVIEGTTDEGAPVAEAEQTIAEEEDVEEDEEDYIILIPSKPSHLDFEKSTMSEADMPMMMKLGYFGEAERKMEANEDVDIEGGEEPASSLDTAGSERPPSPESSVASFAH